MRLDHSANVLLLYDFRRSVLAINKVKRDAVSVSIDRQLLIRVNPRTWESPNQLIGRSAQVDARLIVAGPGQIVAWMWVPIPLEWSAGLGAIWAWRVPRGFTVPSFCGLANTRGLQG